jgi:hypothetical protein
MDAVVVYLSNSAHLCKRMCYISNSIALRLYLSGDAAHEMQISMLSMYTGCLQTFLRVAVVIFVMPILALASAVVAYATSMTDIPRTMAPTSSPSALNSPSQNHIVPSVVSMAAIDAALRSVPASLDLQFQFGQEAHKVGTFDGQPTPVSFHSLTAHSQLPLKDSVADVGGDGRDRFADALRSFENRLDNAVSGAGGALMRTLPPVTATDSVTEVAAKELVQEAVELVHQVHAPTTPVPFIAEWLFNRSWTSSVRDKCPVIDWLSMVHSMGLFDHWHRGHID